MKFKDWLDSATGKSSAKEELSLDDLLALERYEEALARIEERVRKRPGDRHAQIKLADVLVKVGRRADAVDQYIKVVDGYARDGFFDKAAALLTKVKRRLPGAQVDDRLLRLERMKNLDRLRQDVVGSLPRTIGLRIDRLWRHLIASTLVEQLSGEQLRRVLANCELVDLEEGKCVVERGDRKDELWWIVDGQIAARVPLASGGETELRTFASGDVIGDRALFHRQPWPATYVATRKTVALVLSRAALSQAMAGTDDPKAMLDALRAEGGDGSVAAAMAKMGHES